MSNRDRSKKEFYADFKEKLNEEHDFPSVYMFKFIVPNSNKLHAQVETLFGKEASVTIRESRNGNYISVSAKELMLSAENVINRYREAAKIDKVIAL